MSESLQGVREVDLAPAFGALAGLDLVRPAGCVTSVRGLVVEATGPAAPVGALCDLEIGEGRRSPAEIVGFHDGRALLMALDDAAGVRAGSRVTLRQAVPVVAVGAGMLGRVLDGLGRPLDGRGRVHATARVPLAGRPVSPLARPPITRPLDLGVRAVNALVTCGRGQRLAILAEPGADTGGLLGMLARHARTDANVVALVGARAGEVRRMLERDLGAAGLARSVVVVVTGDAPAPARIRGALLATAIAEHLRDAGRHVLLVVDSLTQVALAQREIGLSVGEPPAAGGHPPSTFALVARLVERAGTAVRGSITGLYAARLGDAPADPIADAVRAAADGHLVLSRRLAAEGHVPAIDVLRSVSHVMRDLVAPEQQAAAHRVLAWLATCREAATAADVANPTVAEAVGRQAAIAAFLRQPLDRPASLEASAAALAALVRTP